jgi:hypothetical protein
MLVYKILKAVVFTGLVLAVVNSEMKGQTDARGRAPQKRPLIGFVQNTSEFDGAGCSLWLLADKTNSGGRRVFLSDFGKRAVMNIDGRDMALVTVASAEPKDGPKKGGRSKWRYRGGGAEVVVDYAVTGVCAPSDESCEIWSCDAVITVTARRGKRILRAHGICGS